MPKGRPLFNTFLRFPESLSVHVFWNFVDENWKMLSSVVAVREPKQSSVLHMCRTHSTVASFIISIIWYWPKIHDSIFYGERVNLKSSSTSPSSSATFLSTSSMSPSPEIHIPGFGRTPPCSCWWVTNDALARNVVLRPTTTNITTHPQHTHKLRRWRRFFVISWKE